MEPKEETQLLPESMEKNNNKSRRKRSFLDALREKYCVNMKDDDHEFFHIVISGKPRNNGTDAELAHRRNIVSRYL